MTIAYCQTLFTPSVLEAQSAYYGSPNHMNGRPSPKEPIPLSQQEVEFIQSRDSFYMATVNEDGWPYLQHRGGPRGFLKVIDPVKLAFADFQGNRQLISTGNLSANHRVSLFLMDYPTRTRLKLLGLAQVFDMDHLPPEIEATRIHQENPKTERVFTIEVVAFDWNCRKFITPRYTDEEIANMLTVEKPS